MFDYSQTKSTLINLYYFTLINMGANSNMCIQLVSPPPQKNDTNLLHIRKGPGTSVLY